MNQKFEETWSQVVVALLVQLFQFHFLIIILQVRLRIRILNSWLSANSWLDDLLRFAIERSERLTSNDAKRLSHSFRQSQALEHLIVGRFEFSTQVARLNEVLSHAY